LSSYSEGGKIAVLVVSVNFERLVMSSSNVANRLDDVVSLRQRLGMRRKGLGAVNVVAVERALCQRISEGADGWCSTAQRQFSPLLPTQPPMSEAVRYVFVPSEQEHFRVVPTRLHVVVSQGVLKPVRPHVRAPPLAPLQESATGSSCPRCIAY
jgi:hypothetical protein